MAAIPVRTVVLIETVKTVLVLVAPAYWDVAAWVAVNVTVPAPTRVIKVPDALMVATAVLLLLYVIAPLLLLVGNVMALNAASPYTFVVATVNVPSDGIILVILNSELTLLVT